VRFAGSEGIGRRMNQVADLATWMFQKAETVNRFQTFIAAYRLAEQKLLAGKDKAELTEGQRERLRDAVYLQARDAVEDTQYEHARWNRSPFMRGKWSVFFIFWQYLTNTLYFIARNQPGQKGKRLRFFAMMLALGGLAGLPGSEDVMALLDLLREKLGFGPADTEHDIRAFIRDLTNSSTAADIALHGISRDTFGLGLLADSMGVDFPSLDMSASVSMGQLVPGLQAGTAMARGADFGNALEQGIGDVGGAAFSIGLNVLRAAASDDPDIYKVHERWLPTAVRNVMRGVRYATRGKETDTREGTIAEFDVTKAEDIGEIVGQTMGFTPAKVSRERELRWMQKTVVKYWDHQRHMLFEDFWHAKQMGTRETIADARSAIQRYNASVPYQELRISREDLERSVRSRLTGQQRSSLGFVGSRRMAPIELEVRESF